mmetsp:Transcript_21174/g.24530  ORF Transcript_21174/g.24530 Transcript_21174/m.24530 type:complete len:548 (-) Transcript_21174:506-2149(-)
MRKATTIRSTIRRNQSLHRFEIIPCRKIHTSFLDMLSTRSRFSKLLLCRATKGIQTCLMVPLHLICLIMMSMRPYLIAIMIYIKVVDALSFQSSRSWCSGTGTSTVTGTPHLQKATPSRTSVALSMRPSFWRQKDYANNIYDDVDAECQMGLVATNRQRRKLITSVITIATTSTSTCVPQLALASSNTDTVQTKSKNNSIPSYPSNIQPQSITVPLKLVGGSYLIYYRVEKNIFRAVLDTGSPFLMIPGSCSANTRAKTGCYREQGIPSGLQKTYEQFDGFEGEVEWRKAPFSFVNATGSMIVSSPSFVFGVADDGIMTGPGGVFFGLIKNTDDWIRPSFLGQTQVTSFVINLKNDDTLVASSDLSHNESNLIATASDPIIDFESAVNSYPSLSLSTIPLLTSADYIPMTNDLRKKYGDPVQHYVVKSKSITIDGISLIPINRKPIYVIFDTGVTGMVVSKELYDQRYYEARERREKRLWGGVVEVSFESDQKNIKSITAQRPLTTPFDPKKNWKGFNSHVIVIGLSFLDSKILTVDIDDGRLSIEV